MQWFDSVADAIARAGYDPNNFMDFAQGLSATPLALFEDVMRRYKEQNERSNAKWNAKQKIKRRIKREELEMQEIKMADRKKRRAVRGESK